MSSAAAADRDGDRVEIEVTGTAQLAAWRERALPPVEQLRVDLWSIPVPIPHYPLRYVFVYALADDSGVTIVDAGWDSDAGWQALLDGLGAIGASISDVRGALITHQHYDHIGLAGRVRATSDAWIALHRIDRDAIMRPDFRIPERAVASEVRWLVSLGADSGEAAMLVGGPERYRPFAEIAEPDRLLEHDDLISAGGRVLRAIHTPGHTPGHLCFVEPRDRLLFAGDHVLPRISPNISADRGGPADPLGEFLDSLSLVRGFDVDEVLPAHEWRFRGLGVRTRQLIEHHERRLAELVAVLRERPGATPWQLAAHLSWSRPWSAYDGRMRISAVTETLAHLRQLIRRGSVAASPDPVPGYRLVRPT